MIRLSSLVRIIEDRAVAAAQYTKAHGPGHIRTARDVTSRALLATAKVVAPKPKAIAACQCVDCGGTLHVHAPDCAYMLGMYAAEAKAKPAAKAAAKRASRKGK